MSDVETDADGVKMIRPPRRIHKSKRRLYESDSDDCDANDDTNDDMPPLPKKPNTLKSSLTGETSLISTDFDGITAQGTSRPKTAVTS
ncbi:unnamed protein product, partial [Callosobruchus maculatus]